MAYANLPVKAVGDTITKPNWDTIKANFEATGVAIVTNKGDIAAATGSQALARLAVGAEGTMLIPAPGEATGLEWHTQPTCRAYNNADLDPVVSVWWTVPLNSERWDSDGMHSTAALTSRLTVPAGGAGIYSIIGNVLFDTSAVGGDTRYYGIRVLLNGATIIAQFGPAEFTMNTHDMALVISAQYLLQVADYIEMQVFTTWDLDILSVGNYSPEFGATWLRV